MKVKPSNFGKFFIIGRQLGWDPEKWEWTVKGLVGPSGITPKLKDIMDELDPETMCDWSGEEQGPSKLRQRIIESQPYNLEPENILCTHGTQHAQFLTTMTLVEPGDEVIVDPPTWQQQQQLCETIGAEVKILRRREDLEWNFDLDELNELTSSKTKLIFVCSPNNPTGAALNAKEMQAVCEIARDCNAYVLSDEIYRGLEYEGPLSPTAVDYYEKAISVSSVSKTVAMDGFRIGWIATQDKKLIPDCIALKSIETLDINSHLDEIVVTAALEPQKYKQLITKSMDQGRVNRKQVEDWMKQHKEWHWVPPKAGYLSFPRYDLDVSSWDLCTTMLKDPYRTYLFPGSLYGFENHLRLGWGGTDPQVIRDGLDQLGQFMETL